MSALWWRVSPEHGHDVVHARSVQSVAFFLFGPSLLFVFPRLSFQSGLTLLRHNFFGAWRGALRESYGHPKVAPARNGECDGREHEQDADEEERAPRLREIEDVR
jgi:hypothetical protein